MKITLKKYRIVTDNYAGYEAQVWRLWWPFWCELFFSNTSSTVERAERIIEKHKNEVVKKIKVVKKIT